MNADAVKMAADQENVRKKERDPILTVGFVVLMLAFATVIGIYVNDEYLKGSENNPARLGDTVSVDYAGSFYGYYGDGGTVFDTSMWGVADDKSISKSFEFTLRAESAYAPMSTDGSNVLPQFRNAFLGLRVGESATVIISPENGYGALTIDNTKRVNAAGITMNLTETMTVGDFKTIYGVSDIKDDANDLRSPWGWFVDVKFNTADSVTVLHKVTTATIGVVNEDVTTKVTAVTGTTFTFGYEFNDLKAAPDQTVSDSLASELGISNPKSVELVKIFYDGQMYYVAAVDDVSAPTQLVLKPATGDRAETVGMFLYFNVTRV